MQKRLLPREVVERGLQAKENAASQTAANQTRSGSPGSSQPGKPHVLICRGILTVLAPPALLATVTLPDGRADNNGEKFGEIERVDTLGGRVAYVVLKRGGVLGVGEDLIQIPLAALEWEPGSDALRFSRNVEANKPLTSKICLRRSAGHRSRHRTIGMASSHVGEEPQQAKPD